MEPQHGNISTRKYKQTDLHNELNKAGFSRLLQQQ